MNPTRQPTRDGIARPPDQRAHDHTKRHNRPQKAARNLTTQQTDPGDPAADANPVTFARFSGASS